ncbi:high mobility group protein HMG-I/HMG-Y isoform X1 [Pipistrellus kuhlii]|uniref:high mobility group protein HMG-I/HMG-Y isoform X1 n=1 Tax=Pipistrellus kuhlii TaxID=59472 RepID=UPI00174F7025|nr:high mobility group protein HMG-I/HMG-Y isoform X1 [Pipistrellus kuhlii]
MAPPPGDTAGAGGPVPPAPGSLFLSSPEPGLRSSNWDSGPGLFLALARLQEDPHLLLAAAAAAAEPGRSSAPSTVAPSSPERAHRPAAELAKEPSEVPTPKRPRGRPKGSKNKGAAKTRKTTTTPGRKPRGRPKKLEKEEEEGISQESSEEEQ